MIVCRDASVLQLLQRMLTDLKIDAQVCESTVEATLKINREKFDGILADFDVDGADEVLKTARRSPANRRSVSFAIIGKTTSVKAAFDTGANFVVYKPLSRDKARHSLRAAHGLMMRERRRYFRHAVDARVTVTGEGVKETSARLVDLSTGGMAVRLLESTAIRGKLQFSFTLPETDIQVKAEGEVTWSSSGGRTGVQFTYLPDDARYFLDKWLAARTEVAELPEGGAPQEPKKVSRTRTESTPQASTLAAVATMRAPAKEAGPSTKDISAEVEEVIGARGRTSLRGEVRASLVAVALRGGKTVALRGECTDLSEDGVGAELKGELLIGERVLLEMALAERSVTAHAEVRHRTENHYGFRFLTLAEDQRAFIAEYWRTLPPVE